MPYILSIWYMICSRPDWQGITGIPAGVRLRGPGKGIKPSVWHVLLCGGLGNPILVLHKVGVCCLSITASITASSFLVLTNAKGGVILSRIGTTSV
jgi:hypothetical protein